ncbi:MAG: type III secretion chaperone [Simkaniaceae bacterium]|nr:type III secretion chaperone [Candidatus Sacchlamyda saccharinae]
MTDVNWLEVLDWGSDELEDLRFVGYSYLKQGKYEIALTFFEALAVLGPGNAYDLQTLGALHLQLNNNLQALNFIERSLKLEPDHLPTKLNRAKALLALGYKRQGVREAEELSKAEDTEIADKASALLMAYN